MSKRRRIDRAAFVCIRSPTFLWNDNYPRRGVEGSAMLFASALAEYRVRSRQVFLPLIAALVLTLLLRAFVREAPLLVSLSVSIVLALISLPIRYDQGTPALALLIRSLVLISAVYLILSYPYFIPYSEPGEANYHTRLSLSIFFWITIFFSVCALLRPGFAIIPFVFLICLKSALSETAGINISPTDYAIIPELGIFIVISFSVFLLSGTLIKYLPIGRSGENPIGETVSIPSIFGDYIVIAGMAVHFSNYFYSGIYKLFLDGPILSWLLNKTPNILLASILTHANPLVTAGGVIDFFFLSFSKTYLLTNVVVLVVQVMCIFALGKKLLMILSMLFFDLMHVVIFLASGIFFWKWILINAVLVAAASRFKFSNTPAWLFACALAVALIAPLFFSVARLAWYDSREVNVVSVQAILDDNDRVVLPSNFFGPYSVTFAQGRVGLRLAPHLPTGSLGKTDSYSVARAAEDCESALVPASDTEESRRQLAAIRSFVAEYHRFAARRADSSGRFHYDLYPHHMWSNPMIFPAASEMDLRRVVGYELVVDALCVIKAETAMTMETLSRARTAFPISLRP